MSIATLKRKTNVQYNNMSVGLKGFSLNGTLRNQGYIGQTSLSRSLPRTLMKGNTPHGYGGCCGKFEIMPNIQSAVTSLNDPNVVKLSVVGTTGMLEKKTECCHFIVKPDANQHNNEQGIYVDNLARKTMGIINQCNKTTNTVNTHCYANYNPFFRRVIPNFTKSESKYIPITAKDYLKKRNNNCVNSNKVFRSANHNIPIGCKE